MNADDVIKIVIAAIVIIGFIIRAIASATRGQGEPQPMPRAPQPPGPPRDPVLQREIEEFRRQNAPSGSEPSRPPRPPRSASLPPPVVVRSPAVSAKPRSPEPVAAHVIPPVPVPGEPSPAAQGAPSPSSSLAAGIFQWLSNPQAVQQVIIAGEILHRPEHRWR